MATKTKAASKAAAKAVASAPLAGIHPPMTAFRQLWVHRRNTALANNVVGFIWALRADAQAMIDAGDAVDPYTTALPFISDRPAPDPEPDPEQSPPAEPELQEG